MTRRGSLEHLPLALVLLLPLRSEADAGEQVTELSI